MTSLVLDLKVGESVSIEDGRVVLTVEEKSGQRARLRFEADKSIPIKKYAPEAHSGARQAQRGINP